MKRRLDRSSEVPAGGWKVVSRGGFVSPSESSLAYLVSVFVRGVVD